MEPQQSRERLCHPALGQTGRDKRTRQEHGRQQQVCSYGEDCAEMLLELYNTPNADTGLPLDQFNTEALGVLRVKVSDILTQNVDVQRAGYVDGRGRLEKFAIGNSGLTTSCARSESPRRPECAYTAAETSWCRTDQWFGGVISPLCTHQRVESGDLPSTGGFVVEARLEAIWVGCGGER